AASPFQERRLAGDGHAADRQGLQRRADPADRELLRRAAQAAGALAMTAASLRRRVLGAGAALAAGALAGCAGLAPRASSAGVVVVGGGYGGATAARCLKLWGGSGVDVTLVERNAAFVSCPLSNLV